MSKYHAQKQEVDGIRFASKREAQRYQDLRLLERAGEIGALTLQVRHPLIVNRIKVGDYIADFTYLENGNVIVEDCKGVRTPVYKLKRKLMLALYAIEIRET